MSTPELDAFAQAQARTERWMRGKPAVRRAPDELPVATRLLFGRLIQLGAVVRKAGALCYALRLRTQGLAPL